MFVCSNLHHHYLQHPSEVAGGNGTHSCCSLLHFFRSSSCHKFPLPATVCSLNPFGRTAPCILVYCELIKYYFFFSHSQINLHRSYGFPWSCFLPCRVILGHWCLPISMLFAIPNKQKKGFFVRKNGQRENIKQWSEETKRTRSH